MKSKLTACVILSILAMVGRDASAQSKPAGLTPLAALSKMLATPAAVDPTMARETLAALRTTDDRDLVPLYIALTTSGDKDWRLFGVNALGDKPDDAAVAALSERLKSDPSMMVRCEAFIALSAAKKLTDEQVATAMEAPDENLQCIAARTAAMKGNGNKAVKTLTILVASKDAATANMARASLLGLGQTDQLPPLREFFKNPGSPTDVISLILEQIAEEKIVAGLELVEIVAKSDQPWPLKARAYRTISAISPKAADTILTAIQESNSIPFRVYLLRTLAMRTDSQKQLEVLAIGKDVIATLAKFELARAKGGEGAAAAIDQAVQTGHPVVLEYILDRARLDFRDMGAKAEFYVPTLLKFIESVQTDPVNVKPEHRMAAVASTILADMGTPQAMDGLKRILSGKYSAVVRVAATGLLRTNNKAACDLARPLLKSGYGELSTDAALVLGRFGDADATETLQDIAGHPDKNSKILVALANYYLLKIKGQSAAAAKTLAAEIK